jgi:hypothetical protein
MGIRRRKAGTEVPYRTRRKVRYGCFILKQEGCEDRSPRKELQEDKKNGKSKRKRKKEKMTGGQTRRLKSRKEEGKKMTGRQE